jgi:hypothetical protein
MDEKKRILKVLEKTEQIVDENVEEQVKHSSEHGISHPNQTNPIYKNLANFANAKIGDKWSIKDLLR